ncbi:MULTISPECIES: MOSC domain-containing protein [Roseobacteraceae]|uniref:MOSC domain protein n=1 Tax=Pseudosulfitobacter pseudonitzschiae TaxID=1402135 RepID=A0A221K3A4_9RHOB|nr:MULTISPECIES: MOSC domain-containing protein [Roseobacteraceae]ASM73360.1 MOSC domain protein [Pseudosulfitobacter pseudonitzschiae]
MIAVTALWRHPIKSHGREVIHSVSLTEGQTMPWDRTWAVTHDKTKFDAQTPEWVSCRNFMLGTLTPKLAGLWAELDEASRTITLTHVDLGKLTFCPDDAADVQRFLAWVTPLCPADRLLPDGIASVQGRGLTDSAFPSISVMNVASHAAVQDALNAPLEPERWRGNIWLDGLDAWAEFDWIDRNLAIGGAMLRVRERIKRCMHTASNPHNGVRDADTLGALRGQFGHQDFGIYAEVIAGGTISLGDKVEVL